MQIEGKRIMILAEQMLNDQEFWYPYYRVQEAGARVTVVGSSNVKSYTGKAGTTIPVQAGAEEVAADDFDALIIPGGYAPDLMRRYPTMIKLVKDFHAAGKVVAAICHAGWMLASADILQGRTVTSFFAIKDDLTHAGATWVDQEVVVDGNLITSRKPDDLPAFMRAVIEAVRAR